MTPPRWATDGGKPLSVGDFAKQFSTAWERIERRFLKLETWQTYREQESNRSQAEYLAGNLATAARLLESEAETDRPLYESVSSRGIDYSRVRLVQLPLSSYLRYEMIGYRIRKRMGERIVIVVIDPNVMLPNDQHFDFLLFDQCLALIHDYGTDGHQVGGWLIDDPDILERLEHTALELRARAIPVGEFDSQLR
jgi:hypothetical protein